MSSSSSRICSRSAAVWELTGRRPVPAQTLGLVEGPISGDDEIVDGRRIFREAGDPETGRDRRVREPVLLHDDPDALRVREAAGLRRVHQDDRELVAAVPGHDAEAARVLDEKLRDVAQDLVPGAVTELVV